MVADYQGRWPQGGVSLSCRPTSGNGPSRRFHNVRATAAFVARADSLCSLRALSKLTDAVEKVGATLTTRNNRIAQAGFLNRSCAFDARLESILLEDPLKIFFRRYRSKAVSLGLSTTSPLTLS